MHIPERVSKPTAPNFLVSVFSTALISQNSEALFTVFSRNSVMLLKTTECTQMKHLLFFLVFAHTEREACGQGKREAAPCGEAHTVPRDLDPRHQLGQ